MVRLSKNIHAGHSFKSFGFRKSGEFEGSFTPKGEIVADDVIVRELVKTEEFRLGSNLRFYESELDNDSISIRGEIWKPLSEELSS